MIALGSLAFHPGLKPETLYRIAHEMMEEDIRQTWVEFASDLAEINSLPVFVSGGPPPPNPQT